MDILRRNTDYALRLAVNLAAHSEEEALSTRVLAEREDVSYQLACKLMQKLHAAGLVESDMGPKGGFRLSRTPEEIAIAEVIEAIQGPLRLNRCVLGRGVCPRYESCTVRTKIGELQEQMDQYLRSVTLGELVQNRRPQQKQTTKTKARRRPK
jgi:Rrf2 family protein